MGMEDISSALCQAHHLLYDGGEPSQRQPTFIPPCDHSTAQLHHNPFGLFQLTAMGKGLPMGTWERNCEGNTRVTTTCRKPLFIYIFTCQSNVRLTFSLGKGSDRSCTDMTVMGSGGQLGAQSQPGKHGAETEALQ